MSLANKESFISFFSICVPFVSFSCLTALARTSNMMLKKCGERCYMYLAPDLNGKASSFSLLNIMLTVGFFVNIIYHVKNSFTLFVVHSLDFFKYFSASIAMILCFSSLACWCDKLHELIFECWTRLAYLRWIPLCCGVCSFYTLFYQYANISFRVFALCSWERFVCSFLIISLSCLILG